MISFRLIWMGLLASFSLCAGDALEHREWVVGGLKREALVFIPVGAKTNAVPTVFVFHGHGGSTKQAVRSFQLHTLWPEAMVVYPQGLNTPGQLTDPEGSYAGWQAALGDHEDRDLKFFDTMIVGLTAEFMVDTNRVFSTGHSNGGAFTYLLWASRGNQLAAVAPSAAAISLKTLRFLKPKPAVIFAGKNDSLVKFRWQERTMNALRQLNQCGEGEPWDEDEGAMLHKSRMNAPVLICIHSSGHQFPEQAPAVIVKFFRQLPLL